MSDLWANPQDKLLDALGLIRVVGREGSSPTDGDDFLLLLEGSDSFDKTQMIMTLAALAAGFVVDHVPMREESVLQGGTKLDTFLDAWVLASTEADLSDA